jgi:hypothetical protein
MYGESPCAVGVFLHATNTINIAMATILKYFFMSIHINSACKYTKIHGKNGLNYGMFFVLLTYYTNYLAQM